MLKKRLKYLQNIKEKRTNLEWIKEIVKTCLFYGDVAQARLFLRHNEFTNKEIDYLNLYIDCYEYLSCFTKDSASKNMKNKLKKTKYNITKKNKNTESDTFISDLLKNDVIFESYEVFILFTGLFHAFKRKEFFKEINNLNKETDNLEVFHYRALYSITQKVKWMERIIRNDGNVTLEEYKKYAKAKGIKRSDVLRIFKATNATWAYLLLCKF
ncbi:hypothetical protein EHP00_589 [Ecytonucleospora hepatopenaei]|uniref:Uncharacterized protein n=1 Tax=Ecytonucleospora hepatopenaei TaxID=646526 RepID=A0A1W0E7M4_9MICR|nr:hypothetical protein EHP00_589 [Ecytonucleospora hepatopenaei]